MLLTFTFDQIRGYISTDSTTKITWLYSPDIALSIKLIFNFRHQALLEITKKEPKINGPEKVIKYELILYKKSVPCSRHASCDSAPIQACKYKSLLALLHKLWPIINTLGMGGGKIETFL